MVSLLKKSFLAGVIAGYVMLAGAVSLEIKDSATWRMPDEVFVNDVGTWRSIKQIQHNNAGVWVTSYHAAISFVTIGTSGGFYGYSHPAFSTVGGSASPLVVDVPAAATLVAIIDDNVLDQVSLFFCSNVSMTQSSFSRLILYDTASSTYREFATSAATSFAQTLNAYNNCTDLQSGTSFNHVEWKWASGGDFWTAADLAGSRKMLLVK